MRRPLLSLTLGLLLGGVVLPSAAATLEIPASGETMDLGADLSSSEHPAASRPPQPLSPTRLPDPAPSKGGFTDANDIDRTDMLAVPVMLMIGLTLAATLTFYLLLRRFGPVVDKDIR